jgi:hypothetical protein
MKSYRIIVREITISPMLFRWHRPGRQRMSLAPVGIGSTSRQSAAPGVARRVEIG